MDCPLRSGHDLADGYIAGTLSDADQDAFEQHFFTCAACLAHVQMLQEVKDGLQKHPVPIAHRPPAAAWTTTPWLGLALAAGLVAAVGWWWQGSVARTPAAPTVAVGPTATPGPLPAPAPPATGAVSGPPPANAPVEAPSRRAILTQLALIVPPRYVPIAVRGDAPPADSFDAAMAHYVAGRHREAASTLRVLSDAKPADPGIAFFWGISELVLRHPESARAGLTRAIAADVQPYEDEAHFYLAKVYLSEDAIDLARQELQYAVTHEAGPEGEAARILAALDRLPR
jgi:Putative zinc-finger